MRASLEKVNRFLDAPLDLGPRILLVLAFLCLVPTYFTPALQHDDVRPAVPGGTAARHLQLQARGRQRGAGRQGDQRPQPLHRDEGPRHRGLHRVQLAALRHRHLRAPLPARGRARARPRTSWT